MTDLKTLKALFGFVLGWVVICAYAQAPSPADVGIVHGNPDVFQLLDSSKTWTPFGSVNPSTHVFTPIGGGGGGGAINVPPSGTTPINGTCPSGQFLYNNTGVIGCATVSGGGAAPFTLYTTHALLTAVTTPAGNSTIGQQGFYAAGDGGAATYNWNASSYCPSGTAGAIVAADGIACVLPAGQSASTAGRYLLQLGSEVDVRMVGMQASTSTILFDNSPYVQALLNVQGAAGQLAYPGKKVIFPSIPAQAYSMYYFSQSLDWTRSGRITCDNSGSFQTTYLVFAPGVDGIIQDASQFSPDSSASLGASTDGCFIQSLGYGSGSASNSSTTFTVSMPSYGQAVNGGPSVIPATVWENGDGIISTFFGWYQVPWVGSLLTVPQGDYVTTASGSTLTLAHATVWPATATGYTPVESPRGQQVIRLPVEDRYNVTTAGPVTVAATSSWTTATNAIPVASCAGITPAAWVNDTTIAGSPNVGLVANCIGTSLKLQFAAATGSMGAADSLSIVTPYVTMTAGPQTLLMPGDFIWNDAFPFGAMVSGAWNYVNNTASGTVTNPTTTIVMGSPCPTSIIPNSPYILAINPIVNVMDTTSNTALGYAIDCTGSTLTLAGPIPPGVTVTSGHTIGVPVYSQSQALATDGGKQFLYISGRNSLTSSFRIPTGTFASVTHTAGSGFLWKLPTGIARRAQSSTHQNNIQGWVFGLKLAGDAGSFPPAGGNTSSSTENVFEQNFIGYLSSGDNTGATSSYSNLYADNHIYDVVEAGTVGSAYFGDNTNSAEGGEAPQYGQVGECGALNYTTFLGQYNSVTSNYGVYCLPEDATLNAPPWPGTDGAGILNVGPEGAAAQDQYQIVKGSLVGPWTATGRAMADPIPAGFANAAGLTTVLFNSGLWMYPGLDITDLNQQALTATISGGTAGTGGGSGTCTFNVNGGYPISGAKAQLSSTLSGGGLTNPLTFVSHGNYTPVYLGAQGNSETPVNPATVTGTGSCAGLTGATVVFTYGSAIQPGTTITATNGANNLTISAALVGDGMKINDPIQLSDPTQNAPCVGISGGLQSLNGLFLRKNCGTLGEGVSFQFNGVWGAMALENQQGTQELFPSGDYLGNLPPNGQFWPVFPDGLALSNGTANVGGERLLMSTSAIPTDTWHKHGDLAFNAAAVAGGNAMWVATADGGSNFRPAGLIANDTAGTSWTLGNYLTLTPVALASLPATCTAGTFAVINNGVAAPVYNAAVGSTTGAATDPVFCTNGNVWKYH